MCTIPGEKRNRFCKLIAVDVLLPGFFYSQEIQMLENHKITVRDRIEEIDRKIAALNSVKEL